MFNTRMLRTLRENIPTEKKIEVVDGFLIEKSVLYNRELDKEIVINEKKTFITDEIAKIDSEIEELQNRKEELSDLL